MSPADESQPPLQAQRGERIFRFPVDCTCGKRLSVAEGAAGARLQCSCGRTIEVPALHVLRARDGLPPIPISTATKITDCVKAGDLPAGTRCSRCATTTSDVLNVVAICEREWITTEEIRVGLIVVSEREVARHGRELIVPVPLRLCGPCQKAVFRYERGRPSVLAAGVFTALGVILLVLGLIAVGIAALGIGLLIFGEALWAERHGVAVLRKLVCQEPLYEQLLKEYQDTILDYFKDARADGPEQKAAASE